MKDGAATNRAGAASGDVQEPCGPGGGVLLTMAEREDAAGMALYRLMFRLLRDYRESGRGTRPASVRYPGQLSLLVAQIEAAVEDCRDLLRRKLEDGCDGLDGAHGPGMAGGDGLAGLHGRDGAAAR